MYESKTQGSVLIAAPVHPVITDGLQEMGYSLAVHEDITQQSAARLLANCVGVVTSTRLKLDKDLLDAAPELKWIARMGSGMEVIDVPYAESKGIKCISSPEGNCNAVGEHAVGMLLALMRRITWSHSEIGAGIWKRDENRGYELEGKTVGIIGFGHTGRAFASKLRGFDVRILAFDKSAMNNVPGYVEACSSLSPIFDQADVLSLHVSLGPDTINYFNDAFLAQFRKPIILINTSRGSVVNTKTLYEGVRSRRIIGACLDVFEHEPITTGDKELRDTIAELVFMPNVIATPHIAGYTHEALYKMSKVLLDKLKQGL